MTEKELKENLFVAEVLNLAHQIKSEKKGTGDANNYISDALNEIRAQRDQVLTSAERLLYIQE